MNISILSKSLHHAILIPSANREATLSHVKSFFQKENHMHEVIETKVLDIETARSLKSWASISYGYPKTMILSFHTITAPAQNALLKVLEEPGEGSRFVLITSHRDALLPTVRSRLLEYFIEEVGKDIPVVKTFLKTEPSLRMKLKEVEVLLEAKDEEDRKDREAVQTFLTKVLEELVIKKVDIKIIQDVADVVLYAGDPSSSGKQLIEYISLRVPRL